MTDNERMTDEHAAYHLLTDAAIKEGKATVNELADAEEAGRQISIGELMARIGDDKAAALLNPNNIEETKAKYEAIEQKMKILRDQLRDPAFTEQLAAAAQRFEVIRPFMDTLAEKELPGLLCFLPKGMGNLQSPARRPGRRAI